MPDDVSLRPGIAQPSRLISRIFIGLVVLYCTWIVSLPLFPTQDGPMHLYYTEVLARILSHSHLFTYFYGVRLPPPPYVLHYGVLLIFTRILSAAWAEKCVVCLIVIGFAYGFRYFARQIGPGGDLISLWAVPLSLNWTLGMGFHNYCLSFAISFWGMGTWLAAVGERKLRLWIWFLLLVSLMLLSHPVPLLLTLAFIVGELLLRVIQDLLRRSGTGKSGFQKLVAYRSEILVAIAAYCSLAYIALFVDWQRTGENWTAHQNSPDVFAGYVSLKALSLVGDTEPGQIYCWSFYFVLALAFGLAVRGLWRRCRTLQLRVSDLLLVASLLLVYVIPQLPNTINGSDFFSDRLVMYVWVAALAAACGNPVPRQMRQAVCIVACVFAAVAVSLADSYVRPVAKRIALMETSPIEHSGHRGIFIYTPIYKPLPQEISGLTFNPDVWVAARYFRRAGAVMLNPPWLDLPISPLKPRRQLLINIFPKRVSTYPDQLRWFLMGSQDARNTISGLADFILFTGATLPKPSAPDPLLQSEWPHPWSCEWNQWYSVCAGARDRPSAKAQVKKSPGAFSR